MRLPGWLRAAAGFCMALVVCLASLPVAAQNAEVTVGVGDNILVVQGTTSPGAFVTISRGAAIGTTTADSAGRFSHTFPAQAPGLQTITVTAQTTSGATTDPATATVNVAEHTTTTLTMFLPSTLALANSALAYTEPLRASGETCPGCTVTLVIDNADYALAVADANGHWSIEIPTASLASGEHAVFVRVTDQFGAQSFPSAQKKFTVASSPTSTEPLPPTQPPGGQTGGTGAPNVPVITFPPPGTVLTSPTIIVRGTADPFVQIELFDGVHSIGSAWSDEHGNWSIPIFLESRDYTLRARACRENICSALSAPLGFSAQLLGSGKGIVIQMPCTLFMVTQNRQFGVQVQVRGGEPPYALTINWGDGVTDTSTYNQNDLTLRHTYREPGRYTGWVEAAHDELGRSNRIYFTVHVLPAPLSPLLLTILMLLIMIALLLYLGFRSHWWQQRRENKKQKQSKR